MGDFDFTSGFDFTRILFWELFADVDFRFSASPTQRNILFFVDYDLFDAYNQKSEGKDRFNNDWDFGNFSDDRFGVMYDMRQT